MKPLLLMLCLLCVGSLQAQTLTVNNNTNCAYSAEMYAQANGTPACNWGGFCAGSSIPVLVGTNTYTSSTLVCNPAPNTFYWQWFELLVGPSNAVGTSNCPTYVQTSNTWGACGQVTLTWTDLGGGSAQVDIN